jgi:hypothetical protein
VTGALRPVTRLPEVVEFFTRSPAWWVVAPLIVVATAYLTLTSIQLGCTIAVIVLVVGLYIRDRRAGIAAAWLLWLVAPFLRRVLFLSESSGDADPLALAPYLAMAAVVGLELANIEMSRRARRLLWLVAAGYAFGVPSGLLAGPAPAAFATFAYMTAAACFVIGYRDAQLGGQPSWLPVLMVVVPFLGLYGFRQYFVDLPEWDRVWLATADITSAGSQDEGRVRVWGTLNSPGAFALVLGLTTVAYMGLRRMTPIRFVALLPVLGALALTYARSAWLGLVMAVLVILAVTRGAAIKQLAPVLLVIVVAGPAVFGGSTGVALSDRVATFGTLGSDESAEARKATPLQVVPAAIAQPLGYGLGTAGEASRLSDAGGFRATDNGYLSLLFQVGPVGFALVIAALSIAVGKAWDSVRREPSGVDVAVFGVLVFFLTTMLAGDQLFGVAGMICWTTCGFAFSRHESRMRSAA